MYVLVSGVSAGGTAKYFEEFIRNNENGFDGCLFD